MTADYVPHSFGDEWVLSPRSDSRTSEIFKICSYWFDQCLSYEYPGSLDALSSNQRIIVTTRFEDGQAIAGRWTRQDNGQYTVVEDLIAPGNFARAYVFSPSGRYLTIGVSGGYQIWDVLLGTPSQTITSAFSREDNPRPLLTGKGMTWLADDDYFIAWVDRYMPDTIEYEVWLYHLGQDMPLDTIEIDPILVRENVGVDGETFGVGTASEDGRWVLFGLGRGAMVIPVVYE